jgi:hypothetical protein
MIYNELFVAYINLQHATDWASSLYTKVTMQNAWRSGDRQHAQLLCQASCAHTNIYYPSRATKSRELHDNDYLEVLEI